MRDYADVRNGGVISVEVAKQALSMLDVDDAGFDYLDRKLLSAVIERFDGGPVGLDNLAAAIGEERDTIEDVLEPYLIQQGFYKERREVVLQHHKLIVILVCRNYQTR